MSMLSSRHVAAFALVAVSAVAQAAGGPLDLSSGSTGFGSTPVAGLFSDVYTFTLLAPVFFTGSVTSAVSGLQDVDFSAIVISGPSGSFAFNQLLPDPFEVWGLASTPLAVGSYTLTLSGTNSPLVLTAETSPFPRYPNRKRWR